MPTISHAAVLSRAPNNLGLVGYWSFNEGVGTKAGDSSGRGNTGTISSATWTSGKLGKALSFNGASDKIALPNSFGSFGTTNDFSISVWFKDSNTIDNTDCIFSKYTGGFNWWCFGLRDGHKLGFFGDPFTGVSTTQTYNDNKWHHAVGVRSSLGTTMTVFVDGVQVKQSTGLTVRDLSLNNGTSIGEYAGGAHFFLGSLDDVRIYNRALTPSEVAKLYKAGEAKVNASSADLDNGGTLESGLVGLWTFDGKDITDKIYDRSPVGTNHGYFIGGATSTAKTIGKLGQGLKFDGSNDYVNLASPAIFDNISPLTISAWVRPKSTGKNFRGTIIGNLGHLFNDAGWMFCIDANANHPKAYSFIVDYDTNNLQHTTADNTVTMGAWQYVAVTWDGSTTATNAKIYINGTESAYDPTYGGQTDGSTDRVDDTGKNVHIGDCSNTNCIFDGLIDDVRIYNRALSASEVLALYKSGAAKINASSADLDNGSTLEQGLVGLWTFDGKDTNWTSQTTGTVTDRSPVGTNTGTLTSMSRSSSPTIGKIGQGLKFDGVDDKVTTASSNTVNGLSIGAWIYPKSFPTTGAVKRIVTKFNGSGSTDGSWVLDLLDSNGKLRFLFSNGGFTGNNFNDGGGNILLNKWNYVTVTWDGTSKAHKIYVNGVVKANNTAQDSTIPELVQQITIGEDTPVGDLGEYFNGSIDDVRIYNRALSASEVLQLYRMGK
ncbi:MAG: LamG domain-containing protein [Patescibacteria group bacterium]